MHRYPRHFFPVSNVVAEIMGLSFPEVMFMVRGSRWLHVKKRFPFFLALSQETDIF